MIGSDSVYLPIRAKIIVPFFVVLLLVGVLGTWLATARLSLAAAAEFDAGLLRASLLANDRLEVLETDRLAQLRAATDTLGVPEAVARGDRPTLARLLTPLAGNTAPANLELRVLDRGGHQLFGVGGSLAGPVTLPNLDSQLAPLAPVQDALAGRTDGLGERNVFLDAGPSQPELYWIGPVWNSWGQAVGAILIGESVADVARGIPGSSFYDGHGSLLSSALPAPRSLNQTVRQQVTAGQAIRVMEVRDGHQVGTLFSDWTLRGHPLGYLGTSLNADGLTALLAQLRLLLTAIFAAAGLLTLLAGALVAWWITRPVEELATATRVIAGGDLAYRARVRSRDEIGSLAQSFNHMAASLADKTGQLEEIYFSSMEALARAIDARDPYTFGHSERVAAISVEIAAAMGLDPGARLALRRAALLHDIGKIGIADRVLHKPTQLNDEETGTMQEHPRIGYEMLKGLRFLQPSLAGVLHHHERWDGTGYPDGIAGSGIPLLVRILTVADVFDALTSERPYRRALSPEAATRAITVESGVRYDPDVVTAFVARRQAIAAIVDHVESKAS
ncbi:MAG TPA: HD domain-containing phosphohydrolase [Candidatus Eisenbacteria bacterium]|nr:HD domain-containing phosphohydrolase [Candidatus Eisenbacteria bacterium]